LFLGSPWSLNALAQMLLAGPHGGQMHGGFHHIAPTGRLCQEGFSNFLTGL
jgi:hypothetical protein